MTKSPRLFNLAPLLAALALPLCLGAAQAELSTNLGLVSDYRYRGISQSRLKPALQGGVDFSQGGLYLGAWASTIQWIKDAGGDAAVEVDLYGGYKGELAKDLGYDLGLLHYQYPGNKLNPSANTTEVYGVLTFGPATLKYSHALSNTFGAPDSKNSQYIDLSAAFELGGITLTPHIGHQKIKGPAGAAASYTDYSLTVAKDLEGVTLSAALVGTDADKAFYASPANGKFLGRTGVVLGVKAAF